MRNKFISPIEKELAEMRLLLASVEFDLMPDGGDPLNFKPPLMEIQNRLFRVRQISKIADEKLLKDFGPR